MVGGSASIYKAHAARPRPIDWPRLRLPSATNPAGGLGYRPAGPHVATVPAAFRRRLPASGRDPRLRLPCSRIWFGSKQIVDVVVYYSIIIRPVTTADDLTYSFGELTYDRASRRGAPPLPGRRMGTDTRQRTRRVEADGSWRGPARLFRLTRRSTMGNTATPIASIDFDRREFQRAGVGGGVCVERVNCR